MFEIGLKYKVFDIITLMDLKVPLVACKVDRFVREVKCASIKLGKQYEDKVRGYGNNKSCQVREKSCC